MHWHDQLQSEYMRKAFGSISMAGSLLVLCPEGYAHTWRSSSPFVGEHRDSRAITHDNGRVSAKMQATKTSYNKYESIIEQKDLFKNRNAAKVSSN